MPKFSICFWNTVDISRRSPEETIKIWKDLGITVAMSPTYDESGKASVIELLDKAYENNIRVILSDYRTHFMILYNSGETEYRRLFAEALEDYGKHKAVFGFFVGDEPDAPYAAAAFSALRVENEMAPHLCAYLNLLPWFDWISERMGTPALALYLDRCVNEGNAKLLSYDCYAQMLGDNGINDYFTNLKEYYLAVKRLNVPFWNIVLSCGHYDYRIPSKEDMLWQLTTSVAHGASGVSWFFIELPDMWDNYRNPSINQLGERTAQFDHLSEVNRIFQNYIGETMAQLTIDTCYHVIKAYGGMELFKPFGNCLSVSSKDDVPLIFSRFHDAIGGVYYTVCVNSPEKSTYVSLKFKSGINLTRCMYGNKFVPVSTHTDPVAEKNVVFGQSAGIWLAPGQIALLKEDR